MIFVFIFMGLTVLSATSFFFPSNGFFEEQGAFFRIFTLACLAASVTSLLIVQVTAIYIPPLNYDESICESEKEMARANFENELGTEKDKIETLQRALVALTEMCK